MALLNDAAVWLPDQIQTAAGVTITYTRTPKSQTLTAVVGQVTFLLDGTGQRIEVADRDFLILVEDFDDTGWEKPQKGDQLQVAGEEKVYEILNTNTGEPAWRYTDANEVEYRIHATRVK